MTSSVVPLTDCEAKPAEERARIIQHPALLLNDGAGIRTHGLLQAVRCIVRGARTPNRARAKAAFIRREAKCIHCGTRCARRRRMPSGAYQQMGTDHIAWMSAARGDEGRGLLPRPRRRRHAVRRRGAQPGGVRHAASLKRLKALGIATAVETTGHGNRAAICSRWRSTATKCSTTSRSWTRNARMPSPGSTSSARSTTLRRFALQGSHAIPRRR